MGLALESMLKDAAGCSRLRSILVQGSEQYTGVVSRSSYYDARGTGLEALAAGACRGTLEALAAGACRGTLEALAAGACRGAHWSGAAAPEGLQRACGEGSAAAADACSQGGGADPAVGG
jgi:hypothetical protein